MKYDPNKAETDLLSLWKEEGTFHRSVDARRGRQPFVLLEGPPTANGSPGLHHVFTRTYKDAVARYKTMRGFFVERRAGWDEHGLPVEIEVQKKLGLKGKADIERYGVGEFNARCREHTTTHIREWEELTDRMGYWLDMAAPYRTSDDGYVKNVQDILSRLFDAGLIYHSHKIVPWAWDSGTAVSNAEVAQGYQEVTDTSAYVIFWLKGESPPAGLVAWTSTPWTLPANVALAVNPDLTYKACRVNDQILYSLEAIGEVTKDVPGSSLVGMTYSHPFTGQPCRVLAADFVKGERTGIVHIAPTFGQDDHELWVREKGGDAPCHVEADGRFNDQAPAYLRGLHLFEQKKGHERAEWANSLVINDLKVRGHILRTEPYTHQYPHNWRTGRPLFYYLRPSWYYRTTSLKDAMLAENRQVEWNPERAGSGRFGEWLENNVDWAISRERFWGTALPFHRTDGGWACLDTQPHRPAADTPTRTTEVLDCWFDSGAAPWASGSGPADLVCEAVDQTRGWFYAMLAIGVGLTGKSPFKKVVCLGHLVDSSGKKMSKSKGNSVDPWKLFSKHGADTVRGFMAACPTGCSLVLNDQSMRKPATLINQLWNTFVFLHTYVRPENRFASGRESLLDEWMYSRLEQMRVVAEEAYENCDLYRVQDLVESMMHDLSNVWVRASRERFWGTHRDIDPAAVNCLRACLEGVCLVLAPIMPFVTDHIWRQMRPGESVHLQDWRTGDRSRVNDKLILDMRQVIDGVSVGRMKRDQAGIKVRQPLRSVTLPCEPLHPDLAGFVCSELNVDEVRYGGEEVEIDLTLDAELISRGLVRDFIRQVQVLRKTCGFEVSDRVRLGVTAPETLWAILSPHRDDMGKKLLVTTWADADTNSGHVVKVGEHEVRVCLTSAQQE